MRIRTLLPFVGLLTLAACQEEKKAEAPKTTNPPAASTAAPTTPAGTPTQPVTPAPANKPAGQ